MSSFLMNSGSYVDPKFLPSDAYSEAAGYMGHSGADYYSHQAVQYPGYQSVNSQHAAAAAAAAAYGARGDPMGYGGYYQQCGMTPQQQQQAAAMHMAQAAAAGGHLPSPLNHLPTARSPVASPPPQVSAATQNLLSHQGGGSLGLGGGGGPGGGSSGGGSGNGADDSLPGGYPSPMQQHTPQQQSNLDNYKQQQPFDKFDKFDSKGSSAGGNVVVPQPQLTPGNDGISSDCSDDEGSPGGNGQVPVVYPWMKKIHIAGLGQYDYDYAGK